MSRSAKNPSRGSSVGRPGQPSAGLNARVRSINLPPIPSRSLLVGSTLRIDPDEVVLSGLPAACEGASIKPPPNTLSISRRLQWAEDNNFRRITLIVLDNDGRILKEGFSPIFGYLPDGKSHFPIRLSAFLKLTQKGIRLGPAKYIFATEHSRHAIVIHEDGNPTAEVESGTQWVSCDSETSLVRPLIERRGGLICLQFTWSQMSNATLNFGNLISRAGHSDSGSGNAPSPLPLSVKVILDLYLQYLQGRELEANATEFVEFVGTKYLLPSGASTTIGKVAKQVAVPSNTVPSPVVAALKEHLESSPPCCIQNGADVVFPTSGTLWEHLKGEVFKGRTSTKLGRNPCIPTIPRGGSPSSST